MVGAAAARAQAFSVCSPSPEGQHESGIHHKGNQGRDRTSKSGTTSVGGNRSGEADEGTGTTAEDERSGQTTDRSSTESQMGEDQGREEMKINAAPKTDPPTSGSFLLSGVDPRGAVLLRRGGMGYQVSCLGCRAIDASCWRQAI